MATTLATARGNLSTTLASAITTANHYKRRQTNYEYPCVVVGWPSIYDVMISEGDDRDYTIDVWGGVEVADDDSADDLASSLLESIVSALGSTYGIEPASFGEELTGDNRTIIWCRLPVTVFA